MQKYILVKADEGISDFIYEFNPITDEEIERTLEMAGNTVRPARVSLVRDQLVMDSGQTRKTIAGNDSIVWIVC